MPKITKNTNVITTDLKISFNDFCMREMKLDITEDGRLYMMDTDTILIYNEKFLKYPEDEYTLIRPNEIELNLLKNARIMDSLLSMFLDEYQRRAGIEISSIFQSTQNKGDKGYCGFIYIKDGKNSEFRSDIFKNESLRMFNLITKLNHTSHLYDFNMFDIVEDL